MKTNWKLAVAAETLTMMICTAGWSARQQKGADQSEHASKVSRQENLSARSISPRRMGPRLCS
jgi:hypothetical protein